MKTLFVVPDLGFTYYARQAALLAAALPRDAVRFHALGGPTGPFADRLRAAGVVVDGIGGDRWLDLDDLPSLRRTLAGGGFDAVHCWGVRAFRAVRRAGLFRKTPRTLVSLATRHFARRRVGWRTRRQLTRADRILVGFGHERDELVAAGLPAERIAVLPPAVASADVDATFRATNGIPADAPLILAVGRHEPPKRLMDAAWAFDILRYALPDLRFAVVGAGPGRAAAAAWSRRLARGDERSHYVAAHPDAARLPGCADVAWVPHRGGGGVNALLEAMAAGRPVVAAGYPEARAPIRDGVTGFAVPPGDQPALARATRRLLADADLRAAVGAAARRFVAEHHTPERTAAAYGEVIAK